MADLKERFYKRETLRHLETANLIEPIEMTIEKLRQVYLLTNIENTNDI